MAGALQGLLAPRERPWNPEACHSLSEVSTTVFLPSFFPVSPLPVANKEWGIETVLFKVLLSQDFKILDLGGARENLVFSPE